MEDLDDLDDLLAMEEDLLGDDADPAGRKRSFQDATSKQEALNSLRNPGPSSSKRTRTAQHSQQEGDLEDEELLALVAGPSHQHHPAGTAAPCTITFGSINATEDQELVELAMLASQGHPAGLPGPQRVQRSQRGGAPSASARITLGSLGDDGEDQELLALVADAAPPSQPEAVQGSASVRQATQGEGLALAQLGAQQEGSNGEVNAGTVDAAKGTDGCIRPGEGVRRRGVTGVDAADIIPLRCTAPPSRSVLNMGAAPFLTVTSQTGERVYCQLEEDGAGAQQTHSRHGACGGVDMAATLRRCRGRLLTTSIESLLEEVDQDHLRRALAEAEADAAVDVGQAGDRSGGEGAGQGEGARKKSSAEGGGGGSLWVHKYSPATFWDLLSDEQINREVVRWLKGWDPCVFGRSAPAGQGGGSRGGGGSSFRAGPAAPDPLGRPEHKVILLAGPPGLGKTTLAHVVARHCGYRPLEINASDDRSGTALSSRILDAVEMRSVMGERRPNCVIIDEIDGATGGAEGRSAIAALLKIVQAAPAAKGAGHRKRAGAGHDDEGDSDGGSDEEGDDGGGAAESGARRRNGGAGGGLEGGSSRRRQLRPLLRPIICICNDLYAPALRPLRDVAKVFHFRKPQGERLAQRLQVVCGWEGLQADKSALRGLVQRTDCDIRACLNTLQFVAKRCTAHGAIRSGDLAGVQVGQKDMTQGAFAVWQDLLQKKAQRVGVGTRMEGDSERHSRLFSSLMDFGEHDLVISGVHENVLSQRFMDVGLHRTAAIVTHLADADRFMRACHRGGDFGLMKYIPSTMVALSLLVASHERPQLQWPKAGADARRRCAANRALLQGWLQGVDPLLVAATGPQALVLEVLPSLMHIVAPPLRPVSLRLYSPEEHRLLRSLVGALLGYGLRFSGEGEEEEEQDDAAGLRQLALRGVRPAGKQEPPIRFRPPLHRITCFQGIPPQGRRLPMAIRQVVTHEVDLEAIRRAEAIRNGGAGASGAAASPTEASPGAGAPRERDSNVPPAPTSGRTIATLAERMKGVQKLQQGAVAKQAAPRGTWLDRLKDQRQQQRRRPGAAAAAAAAAAGKSGDPPPAGGSHGQLPVLYKFHEGYTNAVKRPLRMADLLG